MAAESSFLSQVGGMASGVLDSGKKLINSGVDQVTGFMSNIRNNISGLPAGGMAALGGKTAAQFVSADARDWRVKLSMPSLGAFASAAPTDILLPLKETGGIVFPFTPTVTINHTANYNTLDPVHNNYPFLSYENSRIDQITITGDFYCEDSADARYWVAVVHYLRSVTKMAYGNTANAGSPPPVIKLNGYGDYVFNNVPVVVKSFSTEMPKDVDYIATSIMTGYGTTPGSQQSAMLAEQDAEFGMSLSKVSYAPVRSTISVIVQPVYSREQVRQFSLDEFVKGNYISNGKGYI